MTLQLTHLQAAIAWNSAIILSVLFALFIQRKEIKRLQLDPLSSFVVIAIFNTALIIGARLGAFDAATWQHLFQTGLVVNSQGKTILGGLIVALPVYLILKKSWGLSDSLADALFIALPLAAAVGRLGCVAAGCCFGTMTDGAVAWTYGAGMPAYEWQLSRGFISETAATSLPVFPVQILFSVLNLLLFLLVWSIRKRLKIAGSIALLVIGLILFNRFWVEFYREAATNRGLLDEFVLGLKMAQWYCLSAGLLALFLFWKKERKKLVDQKECFAPPGSVHFLPGDNGLKPIGEDQPQNAQNLTNSSIKKSIPLSTITMTLCLLAAFFLLFQDLLSFDEKWIIAISYLPAIGYIAWKLWFNWVLLSKPVMTTSFLSLTAIMVTTVATDTIKPFRKGDHLINIGIGSTNGSYELITQDCDGNITQERIKMRSNSMDAAYQYQVTDKTNVGFGVHGTIGSLDSDDPISEESYNFRAWSPYLSFNSTWLGFRVGPLYTMHKRPASTSYPSIEREETISGLLRIGLLSKYYGDFGVYDAPAVHFYPQPVVSLGLFNWGFNDPHGRKNLRLGLTVVGTEGAFMFSGRTPIGKSNIILEGSFYAKRPVVFGLGLRYHWRPKFAHRSFY